jgi:hypothetical protein
LGIVRSDENANPQNHLTRNTFGQPVPVVVRIM